ncbi:MAG: protein-tyrosine phosphatase family protein [Candidatus Thorarchaeota archaeon]
MPFDLFTFKKNELYGSKLPETLEDLETIKKEGIKVIISLEEAILEIKNSSNLAEDFEHYELFITDYDIPERKQVEKFLAIVDKAKKENKPILVHCWAGCGRTGVMLALAERFIYGVKDGTQAIENLRKVRPCAVETPNQQDFVKSYKRE